ncbi:M23 family metallopeptidase [Fibrella forsythiae]|uniref:M23 family metallopeptidase n=1 Tax=Fibrella forsythiae TaxID=2817061 RepID=A0ABS3JMM7_9BACT|nr:M23 family metallopeptidase [Fibrella forsythiae]MBO0950459.1 M23 family metallopeptidase [Fibrella forsythiae]
MNAPLDNMQIRTNQFRRYDPISNTHGMVRQQGHRPHQGWDLQAGVGTPVRAVANGLVWAKQSKDYGLSLILQFDANGRTLYAFYAHLSEITVNVPCSVQEGTVIARSGMSGNAKSIPVAEAHLHFEIRTTPSPGKGLGGRIDPGEVLGYQYYVCPL